jgi:CubicO group peptidase (beta-lactamase class C family)
MLALKVARLTTALGLCCMIPIAHAQSSSAGYPAGKGDSEVSVPAALAKNTSQVPVAIQELRRHMLDSDVSTLTFHNMDEIFTTRKVGHSGAVWQLPVHTAPLTVSYSWAGQSYTSDQFLERTYTNALLVIKNGQVVSETYRNNTNAQTHFMSWSMAKSITSILVGKALEEGRIKSLDDKITTYLPELKDGGYKDATIRQVLEMRSGVDYEERYDFAHPGDAARNHESSLVENVTRFADFARTVKSKAAPGTLFEYKTLDTAVLGWLVERVTGMNASAYLASRVWEPLGTESDGFYIMDGEPGIGREFTGAGYNAILRDYGRLGLMMLNGGMANGHRILSEAWVKESTAPATTEGPEGGYGYQWWTVPDSNAYYAVGLQGQFIYVDPDSKTVIVKLSYFPPDNEAVYGEALSFMAAASAWKPTY